MTNAGGWVYQLYAETEHLHTGIVLVTMSPMLCLRVLSNVQLSMRAMLHSCYGRRGSCLTDAATFTIHALVRLHFTPMQVITATSQLQSLHACGRVIRPIPPTALPLHVGHQRPHDWPIERLRLCPLWPRGRARPLPQRDERCLRRLARDPRLTGHGPSAWGPPGRGRGGRVPAGRGRRLWRRRRWRWRGRQLLWSGHVDEPGRPEQHNAVCRGDLTHGRCAVRSGATLFCAALGGVLTAKGC